MSNYSCKLLKILNCDDDKSANKSMGDLMLTKPSIGSVSFHRHGKQIAVTIKGNNMWFCYQVKVGKHWEKIEARDVSQRSIQFNYDPESNPGLSSDEVNINVSLCTHFHNPVRGKVKIDHKVINRLTTYYEAPHRTICRVIPQSQGCIHCHSPRVRAT